MSKPIPKSKQLYSRNTRQAQEIKIPESKLQKLADDYLEWNGVENIRIPDFVWRWIARKAPEGVKIALRKALGGIPDNTCLIPINGLYSLCLSLELKAKKGVLHGKQKNKAKKLSWQIARSPEEIMRIIDKFIFDAAKMNGPDEL